MPGFRAAPPRARQKIPVFFHDSIFYHLIKNWTCASVLENNKPFDQGGTP